MVNEMNDDSPDHGLSSAMNLNCWSFSTTLYIASPALLREVARLYAYY